jgi:hypothetical protein
MLHPPSTAVFRFNRLGTGRLTIKKPSLPNQKDRLKPSLPNQIDRLKPSLPNGIFG